MTFFFRTLIDLHDMDLLRPCEQRHRCRHASRRRCCILPSDNDIRNWMRASGRWSQQQGSATLDKVVANSDCRQVLGLRGPREHDEIVVVGFLDRLFAAVSLNLMPISSDTRTGPQIFSLAEGVEDLARP